MQLAGQEPGAMVALLSFQWDRRTGLLMSLEQWHPHLPKAFEQHTVLLTTRLRLQAPMC